MIKEGKTLLGVPTKIKDFQIGDGYNAPIDTLKDAITDKTIPTTGGCDIQLVHINSGTQAVAIGVNTWDSWSSFIVFGYGIGVHHVGYNNGSWSDVALTAQ